MYIIHPHTDKMQTNYKHAYINMHMYMHKYDTPPNGNSPSSHEW